MPATIRRIAAPALTVAMGAAMFAAAAMAGGPWALIGAVGGASFVGALFVLSRRQ